MTAVPAAPAGSNTVNPFVMTDDASALITFVTEGFGAIEVPEARTLDRDGLILHSELLIGDSMIRGTSGGSTVTIRSTSIPPSSRRWAR